MINKFPWGRIINRFDYDFDGSVMEVVKFHPWKVKNHRVLTGQHDEAIIHYHCEELHESSESLQYMLLAWIAYKNLGLNEGALVRGVAKAMGVYEHFNRKIDGELCEGR